MEVSGALDIGAVLQFLLSLISVIILGGIYEVLKDIKNKLP
jgi:hypothetical protein